MLVTKIVMLAFIACYHFV